MPALEAAGVFSVSASSPPAGFDAPVFVAAVVSGALSVAAVAGTLFSAAYGLLIVVAVVDLIAVAGFWSGCGSTTFAGILWE